MRYNIEAADSGDTTKRRPPVKLVQRHLSFSSINQFAQCKRSWFAQRVLGKQAPAGSAANWGLAFEAAVTRAMGATVEKADKDDRAIVDPGTQAEIDRAAEVYFASPGAWKQGMPGTLTAQRKIEIQPGQWGTLCDCYGAAGSIHLPLIGYIDLLHTDASGFKRTVCDLKTTTQAGLKPDYVYQTALYCIVARAQQAEVHVLIRPQERETKNPRPEDYQPTYRSAIYRYFLTDDLIRDTLTWVGATAEDMYRVEQQSSLAELPATPCANCSWCTLATECTIRLNSGIPPVGGTASQR